MRRFTLGIFFLLACVLPGLAAAIPVEATAFTARDLAALIAAHHRRTVVEAYIRLGDHTAGWDTAAAAFLQDYTRLIAEQPDAPAPATLAAQGALLLEGGCADAQVLYAYGTLLHQLDRLEAAEGVLRQAVAAFDASAYPRSRACLAPRRLIEVARACGTLSEADFARWRDLAIAWTADSLTDGSYTPDESRAALAMLELHWDDFYAAHVEALLAAVQTRVGADPYVVAVLRGRYEIERAGRDVGGQPVAKLSPDAKKRYLDRLLAARALLVAAWQAKPACPEAPTALITVALGRGAPEDSPRAWFDRAVAAQMDYLPAYRAYREALRPRAGGSLEAMHAFAIECLKTNRYNTDVPAEYYHILTALTEETGGDPRYWRLPETYPRLRLLCQGYAAVGYRGDAAWYGTVQAGAAWRCGRYAEARAQFLALGDTVQPAAIATYFRADYATVRRETFALAGVEGAKLVKAGQFLTGGKAGDAQALYAKIVAETKDADAKAYAQTALADLRRQAQWERGAWVPLQPNRTLAGWTPVAGAWRVEADGALRGTSDAGGLLLLCDRPLGSRLEVRGEIEFVTGPYEGLHAAILANYQPGATPDFIAFTAYGRAHRAGVSRRFHSGAAAGVRVQVKDRCAFVLRLEGTTVTATIDGRPVTERQTLPGISASPRGLLGLGGDYWYPGAEVRFRKLEVRKLPATGAKP